MSNADEFETFALDEVCRFTGAPSADWLYRRIVAGELTAVLAGREWRMTRGDMCRLVDLMRAAAQQNLAKRPAAQPAKNSSTSTNRAGLSKRGAARLARKPAA